MNNNIIILKDVHYINYKLTTKNGIIENEMSSADVGDFIKLINDLKLEEIKEKDSVKGWLISLDCYNKDKEFMYNVYLINNLFYVDQTVFYVDKSNLTKLHHFINSKLL